MKGGKRMKQWIIQSLVCGVLVCGGGIRAEEQAFPPPPPWAKDLVIYEIATKAFTSPEGAESGTFRSTAKKMPYLRKLGVNAIWLAGHSLADSSHFYGIWTQYACIEPDKIEPSLGSEQDLEYLVSAAHREGIKVFLDVITHGVMENSPLIRKYPEWFMENGTKGSWGMVDYCWQEAPKELDEWWVDLWTRMVLETGIDGFRCDISLQRPDLWAEVKRRCAAAGRPVFLLAESDHGSLGADAYQLDIRLDDFQGGRFKKELAAFHDMAQWNHELRCAEPFDSTLATNSAVPAYRLIQLSCHDGGWAGYPAGVNPYTARGSRFAFGYGVAFAPTIIVFMAGEEFDAEYVPLPRLAPDLFGNQNPDSRKSRWLYGSWIQWEQLNKKKHADMLKDVRRMLAIRKAHRDLIHAIPKTGKPDVLMQRVEIGKTDSEISLPIPYTLSNGKRALVIAANPLENPVQATLRIAVSELGFPPETKQFKVVSLWPEEQAAEIKTAEELAELACSIPADHQAGGGLCVIRIEPIEKQVCP